MTQFGRQHDLEQVERALARARSGAGTLLLFTGEAGIGKSTLAREAGDRAVAAGMRLLWGRCWEAGGAVPYWPWVQVFRGLDLNPFADVSVEAQDFQQQRFRLFDAAAQILVSSARQRPLAIVLDDLHAADAPSLHLLLFVARQMAAAPLFVLGTAREAEARVSPSVRDTLATIGREGEQISLRRLTRQDVARWVMDAADPDEVYRLTEGNPLFVKEVLRVGLRNASDGIHFAIDEHLRLLPDETRALLDLAAVLGREFAVRELSMLASITQDAVRERLRSASAAGVVDALDGAKYQFTHMLLRDRLYETLSDRSAIEWKVGLLLEKAGAPPAIVAHHLLEGASTGDAETAVRTALRAAAAAEAELAFEASALLTERALALLGPVRSRLACELEIAHGVALMRSGALEAGRSCCVLAADHARALGAADELARAALAYSTEMVAAAIDPVMVRLLEDARTALGPADSALAARVGARLAAALVPPPTRDEAARLVALARGAIDMARRLRDPQALLYTLLYARAATIQFVHADETFATTTEIVELARAQNERTLLMIVGPRYATSLLELGRRAEAQATLAAVVDLDAQLRSPMLGWRIPMLRAAFAMFDGRLDDAAALGDEAMAVATRAVTRQADAVWATQRIALAIARGEPAGIASDAERVLAVLGDKPLFAPARAWVLAALGRVDEARLALSQISGRLEVFTLMFAAEACALLESGEMAAQIYDVLLERRQGTTFFWGGMAAAFALGPAQRLLGNLAALMGRKDEARAHYQETIAVCRRAGAKPFLELSLSALERLESDRRESGEARTEVAPAVPAPLAQDRRLSLEREGDVWTIRGLGRGGFSVRHSKGLSYLSMLLENPGRPLHVLSLIGVEHRAGDAGPVLDTRARADYHARLTSLQEQIAEAESFGDRERARRGREELEALADQLAAAVGLGGRERRAASDVERARINVQRCIKDAVDRIGKCDAEVGRYIAATVTTGTVCCFTPI